MPQALDPNVPQDRPTLSVPGKAFPAAVLYYLFWASTPPVAALALGGIIGTDEPISANFLPIFGLALAPILIVVLGMRLGSLKALWFMWATAYAGAALAVLDMIAGLLVTFGAAGGSSIHDRSAGEFILIAAVIIGTLCVFLFRAMRKVRWLDPRSTPSEWEPALRGGSRRL